MPKDINRRVISLLFPLLSFIAGRFFSALIALFMYLLFVELIFDENFDLKIS
jgi:hypothetical protein